MNAPPDERLSVTTILGTRPEIIRLSCVIQKLEEHTDHRLVHTGQNYDFELNQVFFEDLGLRQPDAYLNVDTSSLGAVLGGVLIETEKELRENRPDAVVILGDTNSALAAIVARRLQIPVYHMEAGNRCFDANVPEETNRRIVDHTADFNLVYTDHARHNLLRENIEPRRIYLTGSPMREVLSRYRSRIDASTALTALGLMRRGYYLVSMHREENVDDPHVLRNLVEVLDRLANRGATPVVVSTHPRTRKRMEAFGIDEPEGVEFCKPFSFSDYNKLQLDAKCVISDSGTISEESGILGFPAVTIRNALERPEALDAGCIVLCGTDPSRVMDAVRVAESRHVRPIERFPQEYCVNDTSDRVLALIVGTAKLAHRWQGIVRRTAL